jgi:hypothetical protein
MTRALCTAALGCLLAAATAAQNRPAVAMPGVLDLDDAPFDVARATAGAAASVFIFTAIECPISSRYAPEIRRIAAEFAARGVRTWLVFANPADNAAAIRAHLRRFELSLPALRDPSHELVRRAGAMISPEAAVFDPRGRVAYHGRIDDRWVEFGRDRPTPTRRDLVDALTAVLAGRPVAEPVTQAVGCYLADFRR